MEMVHELGSAIDVTPGRLPSKVVEYLNMRYKCGPSSTSPRWSNI
jgi:hypothetical protein